MRFRNMLKVLGVLLVLGVVAPASASAQCCYQPCAPRYFVSVGYYHPVYYHGCGPAYYHCGPRHCGGYYRRRGCW